MRAEERTVEKLISAFGSLAAQDLAVLSVKVPGRIQTMTVDLGSAVQKGDLIAQVEPRDYELRLRQAEAALAQARARLGLPLDGTDDRIELEKTSTVKQAQALLDEARKNRDRILTLSDEGILSQSELETATAEYEVALNRCQDALEESRNRQALLAQRRAELEIARQQLADTAVHAPFAGTIQERRASLGEYVTAGFPVVTLVRMDPLRLRLEVSERDATSIRAAQKVRLHVEGDTNTYTGEIKRLSPTINEQNRILLVEADVPNNGALRPGAFVRAEIITDENRKAVTVPAGAVVTFAGIEKVFLVQNGKALEKPVAIGRRMAGGLEVLTGVKAGDWVVVDPGNLQSGQMVTPKP
ncbi:MAG: efflux RND transporter periplasmic adaptor subunit [Chloroflexi bacterium]|nr:efflux RND transporter periplasmic adaptor subunit [Chloroflexota bacterium]